MAYPWSPRGSGFKSPRPHQIRLSFRFCEFVYFVAVLTREKSPRSNSYAIYDSVAREKVLVYTDTITLTSISQALCF